ncbi:hypothetical protein PanWU01x14_262910 [Parasponia andersonii]|uniref:Pentatricopeptide repeat n=1 Tax=Parasponia andersonii TaxID=3476 RepID=A0A2P5B7Z5_PARAD|nr:hypothetical protein PanWU01x14_262910 [Parasponia andersonii]
MVQQMKDLGFNRAALPYNVLFNLNYKSGNHEKINSLVQEMDEKGICYDRFTYGIWLSACVVDSNMTGITDILTRIASDSEVVFDWLLTCYVAAKGYIKSGPMDKSLARLEMSH